MKKSSLQSVHALEIPTNALSLLVPSACVAEVGAVMAIKPLPGSPSWVLGVVGWRSRPVPVVSIEGLMGGKVMPAGSRSKIIILYPLPGRPASAFFGILAASEPQSRTIDSSALENSAELDNPFIAAALKLDRGVVGIPDFDALKKAFYPA